MTGKYKNRIKKLRTLLLTTLPFLVLLLGLGITSLFWYSAVTYAQQNLQDDFDIHIKGVETRIADHFLVYSELLHSTRGLFSALKSVKRDEFKAFINAVGMQKFYPSIQSLGFSLVIPLAEKQKHLATVQSEGFPNYNIHPEGERKILTSIVYLKSFSEQNSHAFGYDMYSEEIYRQAMKKACDTNETALSGKVESLPESNKGIQTDSIMYLPIYRPKTDISTREQRRTNLLGWIYVAFRTKDFINNTFNNFDEVDIDIYDGKSTSPLSALFLSSSKTKKNHAPLFKTVKTLTIVGHHWTVNFYSTPAFEAKLNLERAYFIVAIGIGCSIVLCLVVWLFVHERKRASHLADMNDQFLAAKNQLQATLDAIPDLLFEIDAEGYFYNYHTPHNRALAIPLEEFLGKKISDVLPPDAAKTMKQALSDAQQNKISVGKQFTLNLNQEKHWFELSVAIKSPEKLLNPSFVVLSRDITERKRREEALAESQKLFRTIIDTTPMRIFWKDSNLCYLGGNKAFAEEVGVSNSDELVGKNDYQIAFSEHAELYQADDRAVLESGVAKLSYDQPFIHKGKTRWSRISKVPLKNQANEIIGLLGIYDDVTKRKQRRAKLEVAATVFESKEAMLVTNADSIIIDVNQAFTRLTGYSHAEIVGKHPSMLRSDRQDEAFYDKLREDLLNNNLWQGEIWNKRKNGDVYPEWLTITVVKNKNDEITHHVATMMDITERKLAEEDMKTAKLNAIQANKAKSDFLANMSHELRTPMTAILGFGQLLEIDDQENLTQEQKEFIQEILKAGNHLLSLINEVLDLSAIEAGKLKVSMETIKFSTLLNECIALSIPSAEQQQISIFNSMNSKLEYYLYADNIRLKQVLLNLLSNAIKYNRKQGNITLTAKQVDNERLRILVTDTGEGLTEDQQQKLFQAFERLNAEWNGVQGTGIGLVISKQLIELMGGEIGVTSTLGIGSTFWIELKLSEQAKKPLSNETTLIELADLNALPSDNVLILYIEDNPAILKVVEQLINRRDYIELISASSPSSGLDLAQLHQPDLILLDINLPEMDGYELLRRLRTYEHLKNVPAVAISANASSSDIKKGLDAGFIDYLTKPINVTKFYKIIDRLLNKND
ncbi:MAG: PAS domain S-box protein [Methylococcaceae bacterium]|nr:PAS domain S-box protein [Methylococcaceae bacterium]